MPFTLTPRAFEEHLHAIGDGPLRPALVSGTDLDRRGDHLLITFDDGGKSALYAADRLARRGWPGHFFIVTSLVGTRTFLSWSDIRYLQASGHLVGSHSHTHPGIFRELSAAAMAEEWRISASELSDRLATSITAASVPGGDISPAVLRSAAQAGFRHLFTIEPDPYPSLVDGCSILGRYLPKRHTTAEQIGRLVRFRDWRRALTVRRAKVWARRLWPAFYRQLVRQRTTSWEATAS